MIKTSYLNIGIVECAVCSVLSGKTFQTGFANHERTRKMFNTQKCECAGAVVGYPFIPDDSVPPQSSKQSINQSLLIILTSHFIVQRKMRRLRASPLNVTTGRVKRIGQPIQPSSGRTAKPMEKSSSTLLLINFPRDSIVPSQRAGVAKLGAFECI